MTPEALYIYPDGRVDAKNASFYVGLSLKTLAGMRCSGEGPAYKKIRGRIFYHLDDLKAWLESHPKQISTSQQVHKEKLDENV